MRTIWKFELQITDEQITYIPAHAVVLTIQMQYGKPCLWALVDPTAEKLSRKIITHGTGHSVPETTGDYIGTYMINNGELVFHVFESA